jgi:hypothetical protein
MTCGMVHMTLHRPKSRPPGVARRFEPSRLAGAMLSSAYDALVPELRPTARAQAAATRPPARTPARGRTAIGG